jgi:hypothetical protein
MASKPEDHNLNIHCFENLKSHSCSLDSLENTTRSYTFYIHFTVTPTNIAQYKGEYKLVSIIHVMETCIILLIIHQFLLLK